MKITLEAPFWPCNCGKEYRKVSLDLDPINAALLWCKNCQNQATLSTKGTWTFKAVTDDELSDQIKELEKIKKD